MVLVKNPNDTTRFDRPKYRRSIANYETFLNDQQMLEALQHMLGLRNFKRRRYNASLSWTERVLSMIRQEVYRLEG